MQRIYLNLISAGNWLPYHRPIARALKSVEAAIFLGEICSLIEYHKPKDGWVFATADDITESTVLSRRNQEVAIEKLIDAGLIETKKRGMPARRYFRIHENFDNNINTLFATSDKQQCKKLQTVMPDVTNSNVRCDTDSNNRIIKPDIKPDNNNRGDDRPRHAVVAAAPKVPNGADTKAIAEAYGKAYLADQVAVDAACMSRKITREQFTEALRDFYAFKVAEGARWHSEGDFRKNFLNYLPGWKSRKSVGVAYSRPEDGGGYKRPN